MTVNGNAHRNDAGQIQRATFVLVHGAWHGGWCWRFVAQWLRARGHAVFTPTLTGLGERSHLLGTVTSLDVFIADVINLIESEELQNVVLVGHSFGGLVTAGVADRIPATLDSLVFLDSLLIESGQSPMSAFPLEVIKKRPLVAVGEGGALALMPPDVEAVGIPRGHAFASWVRRRMTPHPLLTYQTPLTLKFPLGNNLKRTYLHCTNPSYDAFERIRQWVRSLPGWDWAEISTGHDAMVLEPVLLAEVLEKLARH
jgi:pimeloyl-ACP methyl ester carboxylesterase